MYVIYIFVSSFYLSDVSIYICRIFIYLKFYLIYLSIFRWNVWMHVCMYVCLFVCLHACAMRVNEMPTFFHHAYSGIEHQCLNKTSMIDVDSLKKKQDALGTICCLKLFVAQGPYNAGHLWFGQDVHVRSCGRSLRGIGRRSANYPVGSRFWSLAMIYAVDLQLWSISTCIFDVHFFHVDS